MKLSVITSLSMTPCSALDLDDLQSEAGLLGEPAHRPRVLLSWPPGPGLACRHTVLSDWFRGTVGVPHGVVVVELLT